jgi:hypothetical protein
MTTSRGPNVGSALRRRLLNQKRSKAVESARKRWRDAPAVPPRIPRQRPPRVPHNLFAQLAPGTQTLVAVLPVATRGARLLEPGAALGRLTPGHIERQETQPGVRKVANRKKGEAAEASHAPALPVAGELVAPARVAAPHAGEQEGAAGQLPAVALHLAGWRAQGRLCAATGVAGARAQQPEQRGEGEEEEEEAAHGPGVGGPTDRVRTGGGAVSRCCGRATDRDRERGVAGQEWCTSQARISSSRWLLRVSLAW